MYFYRDKTRVPLTAFYNFQSPPKIPTGGEWIIVERRGGSLPHPPDPMVFVGVRTFLGPYNGSVCKKTGMTVLELKYQEIQISSRYDGRLTTV